MYLKAYEIADEQLRKVLSDYYKNSFDNINQQQKIDAVKAIYIQTKVNNHIEKEMNAYYQQAINYINKISLPDSKKEIIINFSNTLMNRDI